MSSRARVWLTMLAVTTTVIQLFVLETSLASADVRANPSFGGARWTALASNGQWDPDDVEGRFDFRWFGAVYTSTGNIHLSVSFYDAFRLRRLPREISYNYEEPHVQVWFNPFWGGYFLRQPGGHVIFEWGNPMSNCCKRADVTRPSPQVFSVTFNPCSYADGEEITEAFGDSYWKGRDIRAVDVTELVELSHPNC